MTNLLLSPTASTDFFPDLAGAWPPNPTLPHLWHRIANLTRRYVTLEHLQDRFEELPQQLQSPHPRPWAKRKWVKPHGWEHPFN